MRELRISMSYRFNEDQRRIQEQIRRVAAERVKPRAIERSTQRRNTRKTRQCDTGGRKTGWRR